MSKKKHTFRHKRPSSTLVSLWQGWRKMNVEDIPVGAAFTHTSGNANSTEASRLMEPWRLVPSASHSKIRVLTANCLIWSEKAQVEMNFDGPNIFEGTKMWTHMG